MSDNMKATIQTLHNAGIAEEPVLNASSACCTRAQVEEIEHWPVPADLESALEVTLRDRLVEVLATRPVTEVLDRYYVSVEGTEHLIRQATRYVLPAPLAGVGIDLGAGCGLLASVVAKQPAVEKVWAIEVCSLVAKKLIPRVAKAVLGVDSGRVVPVVGSFNDLRLPDECLDFVIENDSLHHSHDLAQSFREAARVLKPGGFVLCFDRCHPNSVTDEEVERLLSQVYSREFLVSNAYPPDIVLTRRDNGEHEYRLFEWQAAVQDAGLRFENMREFYEAVPLKKAIKGAMAVLPKPLRRAFYQTDNATWKTPFAWLAQQLRSATSTGPNKFILTSKRTTVMLMRKI